MGVVYCHGDFVFALLEARQFADNRSAIIVVPEIVSADGVILTFEQNLRYEGLACFYRVAALSPYNRCGCVLIS